jgi:hypothetical protein
MHFSLDTYRHITDYLAKYYDVEPYTLHDLSHPVLFHAASEQQRSNVDSVLGQIPTETLTQDNFHIYDYGYLHSLQNSKSHLYNGKTFALKQIRQNPVRLEAKFGMYFDMLATCYSLEQELFAAIDTKLVRLPLRSQFHREISPKQSLTDGRGRSAAIGCVALVVFNDGEQYQAIISHRTSAHATRSDSYHLLPAFIFQPMADTLRDGEWSIKHHFYREFLEELFGMTESESMNFYQHTALLDLQTMQAKNQAELCLTGVAFNLLTLRAEVCLLLVIHDDGWWQRITAPDSPIKLITSETRDKLILAPISSDDELMNALPQNTVTGFVPQAIPALWEGVKLARSLINHKNS